MRGSLVDLELEAEIVRHVQEVDDEECWRSRKHFYETGFSLVSYILPDSVKEKLAGEIRLLLHESSRRRDLTFRETSNTPRYMWNVAAEDIRRHNGVAVSVYESAAFRGALGKVAGEPVLPCPYEPEHYVITHLERPGDTHGWHWDDYSFGVIFVVDCPPVEAGGFVQTVPNTAWSKEDARVYQQIIAHPIRSYALRPGDLYILRTDTTMHRVHPVEPGATRTIINMAYAAERDLRKPTSHETMEELFRL